MPDTVPLRDYRSTTAITRFWRVSIPIKLIALAIVMAATPTSGIAADPPVTAHPCSVIDAAGERLACFDAAFPRQVDTPDATATRSAARDSAMREFGLSREQLRQRVPERMREIIPQRIEAKVAKVARAASGERLITFDNGQVWMLTEVTSKGRISAGDSVEIKRAALDSFMFVTQGGARLRTRRIQ